MPSGPDNAHAFTRYQSECCNPIAEMSQAKRSCVALRSGGDAAPMTEIQIESCWARTLNAFVRQRLVPLGGAAIGRTFEADSGFALAVTGAGRYLLGLCDDFDYGQPAEAALVVQPNFEIVFLAPDPVLEATCSRFAERLGGRRPVGTLFRITKASITAAAAVGVGLDQVHATLARASSKPLPTNVEQEVRGWFASFRELSLRPATLIECPDAETAARVLACAGTDATRISDVVLEFRGDGGKLDLIKALRTQGLFVRR
ncbi:MAG: helicase-associated domain-containing protein [Planctomycetota bacterium]|nr:helicase-associated domain-containing protein [Planctomycetota bacterium]